MRISDWLNTKLANIKLEEVKRIRAKLVAEEARARRLEKEAMILLNINPVISQKDEKWILDRDPQPWPQEPAYATILEVKEGWVRYKIGMFDDERKKIDDFIMIYKKVCS